LAHARAAVAVAWAFASRYLVASDDPEVREERRKRYYLLGAREAVTYLEGIVEHVPSLRPMLELARESVRLREEVFKEAGWSLARPIFPPDEQLRTLRPVSEGRGFEREEADGDGGVGRLGSQPSARNESPTLTIPPRSTLA
jgi:hypothetical protein